MSATPSRLPSIDPRRFDKWRVFEEMEYVPDEWQSLFHFSRAKNRILACGTRVGKTFALTPEGVAATVCPSPLSIDAGEWVGSRVWICAPTYNLADKLFLPVARALKRHFPWAITAYRLNDGIVRTIGDGFVERKSTENPDSLVGEQLDAAIIDEAPRVGEFEKDQIKQRLVTRDGWLACIGSPVPSRWFQRDFQRGQRNGASYHFTGDPLDGLKYAGRSVHYTDHAARDGFDASPETREYWSLRVPSHGNTRLSLEVLADWERTMSERAFRQDVLAEFVSAEGVVFRNVHERATSTRLSAGTPGASYAVGWDIARARDYSVLSVFDYATGRQIHMDRFQGPWNMQYARVEATCRRYNMADLCFDATGMGDPIAEELQKRNALNRFARRLEPVQISTNARKRELVEELAAALDGAEVTLLPDPAQLQEFSLFEFRQSEATGVVRYAAPPGFHDDTVLSAALAVHLLKRPMGTASFFFG